MALVSMLYRMTPSDGYITKDEAELRLRAKIRRLVEQHGQDITLKRDYDENRIRITFPGKPAKNIPFFPAKQLGLKN